MKYHLFFATYWKFDHVVFALKFPFPNWTSSHKKWGWLGEYWGSLAMSPQYIIACCIPGYWYCSLSVIGTQFSISLCCNSVCSVCSVCEPYWFASSPSLPLNPGLSKTICKCCGHRKVFAQQHAPDIVHLILYVCASKPCFDDIICCNRNMAD